MATQVEPVGATRRERWAWYLYDFGNSAYASVVLPAVYAPYFNEQVGAIGGIVCLLLILPLASSPC